MRIEDLLGRAAALRPARALLTAVELDLFTALHERPLSPAELAKALGASERGVDALATALAAEGLLERRSDGAIAATADAVRLLSRRSPEWSAAPLFHENEAAARWARLTEAVRAGRAPDVPARGPQQLLAEKLAIHQRDLATADALAAALPLGGKKRVLQLGGGPGTLLAAILRAHPEATAVLFDLPLALDVARKVLPKDLVKDGRLKLKAGSLIEDIPPLGFELVLATDVLEHQDDAGARRILQRAKEALLGGGTLAARLPWDDPLGALGILAETASGRVHPRGDVEAWLRDLGFEDVRAAPGASGFVLATKREPV
jgi:hypothetical protein